MYYVGASSGIGEVTALLFADNKAKLVLAARNVENLERVSTLCQTRGASKEDVSKRPPGNTLAPLECYI